MRIQIPAAHSSCKKRFWYTFLSDSFTFPLSNIFSPMLHTQSFNNQRHYKIQLLRSSLNKPHAKSLLISITIASCYFIFSSTRKQGPGWLSRYSDSLRAGRSGDRILVGARFSAPFETGPGAHPASCTMGTGPFPGVKRLGRDADHPPPSKRRGHERVELYLYSPSGPSWSVIGRTLPSTRKDIRT